MGFFAPPFGGFLSGHVSEIAPPDWQAAESEVYRTFTGILLVHPRATLCASTPCV